ncbi:hypothetical protein [Clostridium sp.]|uniref:hypothetical protein n=1 Tax=Clostridium sp. TaxID=1506 RepID=UPI002A83BFB0|nr:hypothetical protein [Clostridium sp.]MDY4251246.1 hypothetical protein [Clostridium sp.]
MDKEILEILNSLQDDTKEIKSALKEIDRKLDGVVEEVTKANCYEIAKLKIIK